MIRNPKTIRILLICLALSTYFSSRTPAFAKEQQVEAIEELRAKITVLNLINGFYMSKEQLKPLIQKAKEVDRLKKEFINENSSLIKEYERTLSDIKSELLNYQGQMPKDLVMRFHKVKEQMETLRKNFEDTLLTKAEEARNILTPSQVYHINTFKPCIIPPKGPARIGQSQDRKGIEKYFEKVRMMPQEKYDNMRYELADKVTEKIVEHHPVPRELELFGINEDTIRDKAILVFDEVRSLSDADFLVKKEALIGKLTEDTIHSGLSKEVNHKIIKFFFNDRAISILEEKLNQLYEAAG